MLLLVGCECLVRGSASTNKLPACLYIYVEKRIYFGHKKQPLMSFRDMRWGGLKRRKSTVKSRFFVKLLVVTLLVW